MLSIEQLAKCLTHVKLSALSDELKIQRYQLIKLRNGDGAVHYSTIKEVSDYFEGTHDGI